jgi:hypothetical protein
MAAPNAATHRVTDAASSVEMALADRAHAPCMDSVSCPAETRSVREIAAQRYCGELDAGRMR